ncbi:CsxC family protein [Clostridium saccharoperbutylacetonicum]|uniref:CsxC family protein n=1 Tax=Clostridium saccharoperbutylacetonicum TaxID=36745 RepID=UPI0039E9715A
MIRIYYSRQYYNQIKRKQYKEFLKEDNIKTGSIEDNKINDNNIKNNSYGSLEINNDNEGVNKENTNVSEYIEACRESVNSCEIATDQVESRTEQISVTPTVITPGPVFVKIPVVLAEPNTTILVEATITLDQAVMEIKRIKNNVFLTESRIISFCQDNPLGTGIIFIAGFIRKNIEYTTQTCTVAGTPNAFGDIRHCTVEVPFNFTTRITFLRPPIFIENSTTSELEFFTDELQGCNVCSEPAIGCNPCNQSSFVTEFFNERPFTELVRADIAEVNIHTGPTFNGRIPIELMFTQITEKVVVNLTLKVLQKQQVRVTTIEL